MGISIAVRRAQAGEGGGPSPGAPCAGADVFQPDFGRSVRPPEGGSPADTWGTNRDRLGARIRGKRK